MSQIAGELRLELSQYRELEAFAEFSSDLDDESKAQLARGDRLMEILKQRQYSPLTVEEQVVSLYVAVENHLVDIEVADIGRFEEGWLRFVKDAHGEIIETLHSEKKLSDELRTQLDQAVVEFKERFVG
jgi:F-type H+/Na+-transporting ATPase subunit alpha